MSKIPAILSATLTVSLAACGGSKDHTPIGRPVTVPLTTADAASPGQVTVFNSTDGLYLTATAAPGWEFRQTRLSVTRSLDCIPHSRSGQPNINRFMLRKEGRPSAPEFSYTLPLLVEPGTELFIALYAEVHQITAEDAGRDRSHGDCGDDYKTQAAWTEGTLFPGDGSSRYFTYVVRDSAPVSLAGQYRTYAQETWGADTMNDATTYLSTNFAATFPQGLTIGTTMGASAIFRSAGTVGLFLPQVGPAASLIGRRTDPANLSNALAGHAVALSLSLGFDAHDPAFCPGSASLGSLVVADPGSPFFGLSVSAVLSAANELLAGRVDPLGATLDEAAEALRKINANFENGHADLGFLNLP
ncbi:MAG: hypothetical protein JO332_00065 [Planctomycetaceae bacterium]|nr:hypothetical protein [Planctomycetaceae bacterium]